MIIVTSSFSKIAPFSNCFCLCENEKLAFSYSSGLKGGFESSTVYATQK